MVADLIPARPARDALRHRLEAVFDAWGDLCPGVSAPRVTNGFPVDEPPCYVAVDTITDNPSTAGAATMGHVELQFDLNVWLMATNADLQRASDALTAYQSAVFAAVLADQSLGRTVDWSMPKAVTGGTAADGSKRYIAACKVAVTCGVGSVCPAEIKEIVDAANREDRL